MLLEVNGSVVRVMFLSDLQLFQAEIPGLQKGIRAPQGRTIAELAQQTSVLLEMQKLEQETADAKRVERKNKKNEFYQGALE